MNSLSLLNHRFVSDYKDVIHHHIQLILHSRLILDEDMQLIQTFWNPSVTDVENHRLSMTFYPYAVSFGCAATFGYMVYDKLRFFGVPSVTVSILPLVMLLYSKLKYRRSIRKYKREFENLVNSLSQIYEINQKISDYFYRRDTFVTNNSFRQEIHKILLKPGEEFLKTASESLFDCLEQLRFGMTAIAQIVPIIDGEFVHNLNVNFDEYKDTSEEINLLITKYRKLSDLFILFSSNFLSSIGLSFCIQLWRDKSCQFEKVFNVIIPETLSTLGFTLSQIKCGFDQIRFNLNEFQNTNKKASKDVKTVVRVEKPLEDLLTNLQISFEIAKGVQFVINNSKENFLNEESLTRLTPTFDKLNDQFKTSENLLKTITKIIQLNSKQNVTSKLEIKPSQNDASTTTVSSLSIHHDDEPTPRGDEEYNLSIHGSDEENGDDVDSVFIDDYVDSCSTEYLELMLLELKKKLRERKGETQPEQNQIPEPPSRIPLPPPRPSLSQRSVKRELPSSSDVSTSNIDVPIAMGLSQGMGMSQDILRQIMAASRNVNIGGEEFQFGFNMYPEIPRPFNTMYSCYSVAMLPGNERLDVERGGKIIMPPSALEQLTRLNINYPMLFKIINKKINRTSHCGVLEFVADEGKVYLPLWMMQNLVLEEGDLITIESVSLSVGTFAKFQPLSTDFLDITNPKAVLENCLRTFACLTSGDVIAVTYNQKVYELCVLETKPGNAISIIECDMNVEFAAPVGYKEQEPAKPQDEEMVVDPADLMPETSGFVAFRGAGNRLDGKPRKDSGTSDLVASKPAYVRGIPDYDYTIGTITFQRHSIKSMDDNKEQEDEFKVFGGEGFKLRCN